MNDAKINALLARNTNNISSPVLKAAAAELAERQKKQATESAIANLAIVQNVTEKAVDGLRHARKIEKAAKNYLVSVGKAETQFFADGDYEAYNKNVRDAQLRLTIESR